MNVKSPKNMTNHPRDDKKQYGKAFVSKSGRIEKTAPLWLYGRHAVAAALQNPERKVLRLAATKNAILWLQEHQVAADLFAEYEDLKPAAIDKLLPSGAVHQGLAAQVTELSRARLKETCKIDPDNLAPIIVLDQITDPQKIGAIFRSAAAFNARAIIVQDRRTPPLSGALAKAAVGAIEKIPCIKVVNIARSIEALQEMGYHTAGLAGEATDTIKDIPRDKPIAFVMGAEGSGLRQLVGQSCAQRVRIPINSMMESLNVSTAAAISLYEFSHTMKD